MDLNRSRSMSLSENHSGAALPARDLHPIGSRHPSNSKEQKRRVDHRSRDSSREKTQSSNVASCELSTGAEFAAHESRSMRSRGNTGSEPGIRSSFTRGSSRESTKSRNSGDSKLFLSVDRVMAHRRHTDGEQETISFTRGSSNESCKSRNSGESRSSLSIDQVMAHRGHADGEQGSRTPLLRDSPRDSIKSRNSGGSRSSLSFDQVMAHRRRARIYSVGDDESLFGEAAKTASSQQSFLSTLSNAVLVLVIVALVSGVMALYVQAANIRK
mmetsp:Transcript_47603/g.76736  ORF Transcript_47603/g.76736 Transcript_47603/m.76736 type:complete len:271 (+) Transcript_47603:1-813(+)